MTTNLTPLPKLIHELTTPGPPTGLFTTRRGFNSNRSKSGQRRRLRRRPLRQVIDVLYDRRVPQSNHRLRHISTRSRRQTPTRPLSNVKSKTIRPTLPFRGRPSSTMTHYTVRRSTRQPRHPLARQGTINTPNRRGTHSSTRHKHSRSNFNSTKGKDFRGTTLLNRVTSMGMKRQRRTLHSTREDLPRRHSTPTGRNSTSSYKNCMPLKRSLRRRIRRRPHRRRNRWMPRKSTKRGLLPRMDNHIKRTWRRTTWSLNQF